MLTLLVTCGIAYLIWRISEQLPDLIFRLSEIQRDLAEIRRQLATNTKSDAKSDTTLDTSTSANTNTQDDA